MYLDTHTSVSRERESESLIQRERTSTTCPVSLSVYRLSYIQRERERTSVVTERQDKYKALIYTQRERTSIVTIIP